MVGGVFQVVFEARTHFGRGLSLIHIYGGEQGDETRREAANESV